MFTDTSLSLSAPQESSDKGFAPPRPKPPPPSTRPSQASPRKTAPSPASPPSTTLPRPAAPQTDKMSPASVEESPPPSPQNVINMDIVPKKEKKTGGILARGKSMLKKLGK